MTILFLPNVILLFVLSILCVVVTIIAWQRWKIKGAAWLGFAMLSTSIWSLAAAIEAGVQGQADKVLWSQIEYIGSTNAIPFLFVFMLVYLNRETWINKASMIGLWFIPVLTLILAWTNEWHGWVWTGFSPDPTGRNVLVYHHGPAFWVYIGYSYLLFITIIVTLAKDFFRANRLYRWQISTMIVAGVAIAVSGVLYLTPLNPIPGFDWTPIGTASAGLVFLWGILNFRLLDLVPIARAVLVEQLVDGIVVLDPMRRLVDINPAAQRMLKIHSKDWIGQPAQHLFESRIDLSKLDFNQPVCRVECLYNEFARRYFELQSSLLHDRAGCFSGWLILLHDITDRKQAEIALQQANDQLQIQIAENQRLQEKLREQAIHDALTGLYNRRFFDEILGHELEKSRRGQCPVGIVMIDIDNFKQLNDTYGHKAGDLILQELSDLLRSKTRKEDIISRYGGEEFVLILPGMTEANASRRADEWRRAFSETELIYQDQAIHSTISIGVAAFPSGGDTPDEVIRKADLALYAAKSAGRNRVAVNGGTPRTAAPEECRKQKAD